MRAISAAFCLLSLTAASALAQRGPEIVVPGRPGVPVLMNGIDVSWSVIEGDFGLDRPGAATPTVIYRPFTISVPYYGLVYGEPGYYPRSGRRPGYGRLEIMPPRDRRLPPPAPTYYRSWSSDSALGPVTDYPPYTPSSGYQMPNATMGTAPEAGEANQGVQQQHGAVPLPGQPGNASEGSYGSPAQNDAGRHDQGAGASQHQSQGFYQPPGQGYSQAQTPCGWRGGGRARR